MDKYVGKRLDGRYEIKQLIGIGGMANIYLSYDQVENRDVAIKILQDEYLSNDEFRRRFRNESKAIAVLNHPNIVKIYDLSFGDNIQYIVMEHVDGITIKEYLEQKGKLDWKEALHYISQILRALQHAHSKGIMHRDIKPQNVMLKQDGTIKVMDFGIACFASEGRATDDVTYGSVQYMSPEQARGDNLDEKTDIYSVGVMLYEMLTGELPFDNAQPFEIVRMKMSSDPRSPREINPDIPVGLEEIILRAMQRNTSSRYQTVSEMLRDIDTFKSNPTVTFNYRYFAEENEDSASRTRVFRPVTDNTPANNKPTPTEPDDDDSDEEDEEEEKQKSKTIPILAGIAAGFVVVAALVIFLVIRSGSNSTEITLPNFVGQTLVDVQEEYKDRLEFSATYEYNSEYAAGVIFEQNKAEGKTVKEGTTIKVTVSSGAESQEIPDVSGMKQSEAQSELERCGFTSLDFVERNDATVASGYVIATYPVAGTSLSTSDTVTVYVSKGATTVTTTVPNLSKMTQSEAKAALEAKGLSLGTVKEQYSSTVDEGLVVAQSVTAGSTVNEGTTVNITISAGPEASSATSSESTGATVSVSIPSSATGSYQFRVYIDGVYDSSYTKTVDVSTVSSVSFNIEGGQGTVEVGIKVVPSGGSTETLYARFSVNTETGKVSKTVSEVTSVFSSSTTSSATSSKDEDEDEE